MPDRSCSRASIWSGMPAHRRVRLGLARTFQKIRLFKQLSVLDNVVAGTHTPYHIRRLAICRAWRGFPRDHARAAGRARWSFWRFRLSRGPPRSPASLAYGEQRMLEIARALATTPRLLMVDEPAAGLNAAEVDAPRAADRRSARSEE